MKHDFSGIRVLVADDGAADRLLIKTILNKLGVTLIQEAADGDSASRHIQNSIMTQKFYNLVLTDWNMPGKSGLDLIAEIREARELDKTAVVLITSVPAGAKSGLAAKIGVDSLIVKPIQIFEFAQKMEVVLQKLIY